MITFSFNPSNSSVLPLIAASVNTFVVSWNDAADKNESVAKDAFVIPSSTLFPFAGLFPSSIALLFASSNSYISTNEAVTNPVSLGLKENVIIGKLIPAGTGLKKYKNLKINTEMPEINTDEQISDETAETKE